MQQAGVAEQAAPAVLDIAHEVAQLPVALQLQAIARASGMSPLKITAAYMRLAFGPGKISFADFVRLRLFDEAFQEGAVLEAYVGQRRNRDIVVTANHRHDWLGMLTNKVASISYLSSYGLPTIPIRALFAPRLQAQGRAAVLRERSELEAFLLTPEAYPLFGKPVEGLQSLGSMALESCSPADRILRKPDGTEVALDTVLNEIETHYAAGYLFQPLLRPDPDVAALCGRRIACVRVLTALTEAGPRVIRTVFKVPVGHNDADNYWRSGNLLARIDSTTGEVRSATSGAGLDTRCPAQHPDTGRPLKGFRHPHWNAMRDVALEGARLMQHVPLIGWDMACTEAGPVIVEMNESPDFFLVQFADRRGMLDQEFQDFLAFQAKAAAAHLRRGRARIAKL